MRVQASSVGNLTDQSRVHTGLDIDRWLEEEVSWSDAVRDLQSVVRIQLRRSSEELHRELGWLLLGDVLAASEGQVLENANARHNGNLLITSAGHIVHIDFGFIFSNAPGGAFAFENSPFKITQDYMQLIGGLDSPMLEYFKILLIQGFIALRKYVDDICDIVDIMSKESTLPCFDKFNMKEFKERFKPNLSDNERAKWVDDLLKSSINSKRTQWYDEYQKMFTGIEP